MKKHLTTLLIAVILVNSLLAETPEQEKRAWKVLVGKHEADSAKIRNWIEQYKIPLKTESYEFPATYDEIAAYAFHDYPGQISGVVKNRQQILELRTRIAPLLKLHNVDGIHIVLIKTGMRIPGYYTRSTIYLDEKITKIKKLSEKSSPKDVQKARDQITILLGILAHELGHRYERMAFARYLVLSEMKEGEYFADGVAAWSLRELGYSDAAGAYYTISLKEVKKADTHPSHKERIGFIQTLQVGWNGLTVAVR